MANEPHLLKFPTGECDSPATPRDLLFLEINRGRTAYPYRPIERETFRIGSGESCDLRLTPDFPDVHTELQVSADHVSVVAVADQPPLMVGDAACHKATLETGDRIVIGSIELTFWKISVAEAARLLAAEPESPHASETEPVGHTPDSDETIPAGLEQLPLDLADAEAVEGGDLEDMSVEELIDAIAAEEEVVAEFEEHRQQGAAALLHQVYQRTAETSRQSRLLEESAGTEVTAETSGLIAEIRDAVAELTAFSELLDQRAETLAEREAAQIQAADLLLEAQRELASHIDRLHDQLVVPDRSETVRKLYRAA